ncbi:hypothetical protein HBB16_18950 [Pseudonocardia sp. MCCB 268]|nr:hypothetical protein [Pseudonocardia cytotoxica]
MGAMSRSPARPARVRPRGVDRVPADTLFRWSRPSAVPATPTSRSPSRRKS